MTAEIIVLARDSQHNINMDNNNIDILWSTIFKKDP